MHVIDLASFLQALSDFSADELINKAEQALLLIEQHESGLPAHMLSPESLQRCFAVLEAATA